MPVKKPPAEPFSESERASLSRMARDREREDWLKERNDKRTKERWERVKSWTAFVGALMVIKGVLWEPLKDLAAWLQLHIK